MIQLKGKYNKDCKIFIDEVENEAIDLIKNILDNEISENVQVRIMPDTHVGKGIVIGFTMPVTQMVNPNYIGVDIGCSVTSHKLNKLIDEKQFSVLDQAIRKSVPMGMNIKEKSAFDDWWIASYFEAVNENIRIFQQQWTKRVGTEVAPVFIDKEYISALCKKVEISENTFYYSVGTLGGGNHFIEIGESAKDGSHYLTIHSGSRNFGLKVCNYHAKKMNGTKNPPAEYYKEFEYITKNTLPKENIPQKLKELNSRYKTGNKEYLLRGKDMYNYLIDMVIAQTYAQFNHKAMSKSIFKELSKEYYSLDSVYSMHNFIDTTDWIIRKGAIRSYKGEKMVIPFNMRDGILICEGKSNADWNYSAPHGAGRILARNKALQTLSMDEFTKEMDGIYSTSVCKETLDESPMAYKDKDTIMEAIHDTALVIDSVKPIMNIKAK